MAKHQDDNPKAFREGGESSVETASRRIGENTKRQDAASTDPTMDVYKRQDAASTCSFVSQPCPGETFLNPYAPIDMHRANLPHWRQDGVTYFVTFRLADALPAGKLRRWQDEMARWMRRNPKPWTGEQEREYFARFSLEIERWLDRGAGNCLLQIPEVRGLVADALGFFDRERYRLGRFVVAANHVHVIVQPLTGHSLSKILHSWKSFTAKEILKVEAASRRLAGSEKRQNAASTVWQKEYYDRIVRNAQELHHIEQYIERHTEFDRGEL